MNMHKRLFSVLIVSLIMLSGCGKSEVSEQPESSLSGSTDVSTDIETDNKIEASIEMEADHNEEGNYETLMEITVTIGDDSYDAVLYDNAAGRFMADNLPYTVHLNKGPIDYCGVTELEFEGKGFDSETGHKKGEILYYDNWFVIFLNEKLPLGSEGPRIPFGILKNPEDADELSENGVSSADVVIQAAIS